MKILIVGDSFVEGVGAENKYGWAQQFKDSMRDHDTVVSGMGGDNIHKILGRLQSFSDNFDLVILEVGINDSRYRQSKKGNEVALDKFANALREFIRFFRARNRNAAIIILGLTRVNERFTNPYKEDKHYLNSHIEKYDAMIGEVCDNEGVDYVPLPKLLTHEGLLADGIHPSAAGHKLIFQRVSEHVSTKQ